MPRISGIPFAHALRRRGRMLVLCFAAVLIVGFALFYNNSAVYLSRTPIGDDGHERLSKYLQVVTPWSKSKQIELSPVLHTENNDPTVESSPGDFIDEASNGLPKHIWRKDGLLTVSLEGTHPIYELVRRAEAEWDAKGRRASKTLEQAVNEYNRRYNRPPPKGFNHWWDYVQNHDVQLPDEYDEIYRDLEPYWGIDPHLLRAAQAEWEGHQDSFTIGKHSEESIVTIVNMSLPEDSKERFITWGAKPQLELLNEVYQYIPAFRATFSPHDNPNELADWTWRNAALEAAKRGTYLKPEDLPPVDRIGWSATCPHDSPLYLNPPDIGADPTPQTYKTFIHDHRAAMDACYHPQHILNHGSFLSMDVDPVPSRFTAPQLSNCVTTMHIDIHATSMAQTSSFAENDPRWEDKEDDRLFWRGNPTGMWHRDGLNWRGSQRVRLVNLTGVPDTIKATADDSDFDSVRFLRPVRSAEVPVGEPVQHDRRHLNEALMDVKFSGDVQTCEGHVCDVMNHELAWGPYVEKGARGAGRYKYLMDVDGNGWSSRFRWLMSSHALVFKATLYPQWWMDRVQPWVHYVPVQLDYSDLYDALVFFGGDLSGEGEHEEMARSIADAGRDWVKRYWRKEDVVAYMFRLWLEYARVMSLDRDTMTFHL